MTNTIDYFQHPKAGLIAFIQKDHRLLVAAFGNQRIDPPLPLCEALSSEEIESMIISAFSQIEQGRKMRRDLIDLLDLEKR